MTRGASPRRKGGRTGRLQRTRGETARRNPTGDAVVELFHGYAAGAPVVHSWSAEALFYCRSTRPSAYPDRGRGIIRAFARGGHEHPHVCFCAVPWLIDAQGEGRKGRFFVPQVLELQEALTRRTARDSVFINVPFDHPRIPIYLGLISGIVALGLTPRCVLEIPPTRDRLRRLYQLISECRYSIHDLSGYSSQDPCMCLDSTCLSNSD